MVTKGTHRDFLYDVGWQLMDLRQDIQFYKECMDEPYPVDEVISRLLGLQGSCAEYADSQLDSPDEAWHVSGRF